MRLNLRKFVSGANMVRHGVAGLSRLIPRSQPAESGAAPAAPKAPKVKVAKAPTTPKLPKSRVPKIVKSQQRSFKSRIRTTAHQQNTTKSEKRAAGAEAMIRWRGKRKV